MLKTRQASLVAATLAVLAFTGCALKDIRPDAYQRQVADDEVAAGRLLLGEMEAAHGGAEAFKQTGVLKATYQDDWRIASFPFTLIKPYDVPIQEFVLYQEAGRNDGRQDFTNGERAGTTFASRDGREFTVDTSGAVAFEEADTEAFSLRTTGYLLQAPFRLAEAGVVYAMERATVDGHDYDRVFISWNTAEPQDDIDQMIAWIDADTKRLSFLEFTARERFGFVSIAVGYEAYRETDGFWLPGRIRVLDHVGGPEKLHIMNIESLELGVDVPAAYLTGATPSTVPSASVANAAR